MPEKLQMPPKVVTIYGADGCGKSTIAALVKGELEQGGMPAVMIGASSYKHWLTPQVARRTLGGGHNLDTLVGDKSRQSELFEKIAVACYGQAQWHADQGKWVLIDSDPVLKRLIWERVERENSSFEEYAAKFGNYLMDRVDLQAFPNSVVGVNMQGETSDEQVHARIIRRACNSEHDPTTVQEMIALSSAVKCIWAELERSRRGESRIDLFNVGFGCTDYLYIANRDCKPEEIGEVSYEAARAVYCSLRTR